jgi:hypothetical protein
MTIDMKRLGLRPVEQRVMRYAFWARTQVSNGHYLCSPHQVSSAKRLIERKFLTRVSRAQSGLVWFGGGPDDWLVVKLTESNWAELQRAQRSARRKQAKG